jgi:hypothetical protein
MLNEFIKYERKPCPFYICIFQNGQDKSVRIMQAEDVKSVDENLKTRGLECFEIYEFETLDILEKKFERVVGFKLKVPLGYTVIQKTMWKSVEKIQQ